MRFETATASSRRGRRAMIFLLSVIGYRSLLMVKAFQLAPVPTCGAKVLLGHRVTVTSSTTTTTTTTALWSRSTYLENLSRPPGSETSAAYQGYKGYNDVVDDDSKFGGGSGISQLYPETTKPFRELGMEEEKGTVGPNVQLTLPSEVETKQAIHQTEIGKVQELQQQKKQEEQLPSDQQDELKRQLATKESILLRSDTIVDHQAAKVEEILTLQTKLGTMASEWQSHKFTTHQQHVQEIEKLALQIANLQTRLQEQQEEAKRKDQTAQENWAKRTELEAERSQLQEEFRNATKSWEDAYAREKSTHAKDQAAVASQLKKMQKQASTTEQEKMRLHLNFQRELAAKDTSYRNRMPELQAEKANEIQTLQSRLETMAKEYQEYKCEAHRQQMTAKESTALKEQTLSQKLTSLHAALEEQREATKTERLKAQEKWQERMRLEAELSEVRNDSKRVVQGWTEAFARERSARGRDKDAATRQLREMQEQANATEEAKSHLKLNFQRELAAQNSTYQSNIDDLEAVKANKIQDLQSRLETMSKNWSNYRLETDRQQEATRQSTNSTEEASMRQISDLQAALQEKEKETERKDVKVQENRVKRLALVAELSQLRIDNAKAIKIWNDTYAREMDSHAKDQASAVTQLAERQKQANATEQVKMQLQLDFQSELAAKESLYGDKIAKVQGDKAIAIEHLQVSLERTVSEYEEYKVTAHCQQMAANDLTAQKEKLLEKQTEATKKEREKIQESLQKGTKLEAELSQLRIESRKAVEDWKEACTREQSARTQDKDAASRQLQAMQKQANATVQEQVQLQLDFQLELTAKDSLYRTNIDDLRASTAKEIQALQSRLETTTGNWRIYNLATERQQKAVRQTADEKEEVLMRYILDLQNALQEQKEETKQKDRKVQDNWVKRLVLMGELSQLQTDYAKAIQSGQDAHAREKSTRANDQVASVSQLEEIKKQANATEQEKSQLQLDFQRESAKKDLIYRTEIDDLKTATSKEIQTLYSKLEKAARQATDERNEALMRQLSGLQAALKEQKEVTNLGGLKAPGNWTERVELDAKFSQSQNVSGNAMMSWGDVLEHEQKIRARDQVIAARQLHVIQEHVNATVEERLQLQLQLCVQNELAAKDTSYHNKMEELQKQKANEIQDLQSRLEKTAKELVEFNMKTHRQLTALNETGSQEKDLLLQQTANLHAALQEQKEATEAKRLEARKHQEKRMHLEAELLQFRKSSKKGEDDWTDKYASEQSARAQDKDTALRQLRVMQEQARATEQKNVELQLDFKRELAAKDSIYETKIEDLKAATVEDIQALQSKVETTASEGHYYRLETERQQKAALQTADNKEKALLQQITTLQTTLEEQEEAAKQEDVKAQETCAERVELVVKLSQLQEEYRNATKSWKSALENEQEIRTRDQDAAATQLQEMQEQLNATLKEKMQLDLDFQSELAVKDSLYRTKMDEVQEEKAMEIQAQQIMLDRTTKEWQDNKSKKDRELEALRMADSQEKHYFSQEIAELQTTLQEQTETVKREESKAKENWTKRVELENELLQVQTDYAKVVKDLGHALEEGRHAPDKNGAAAAQLQTMQKQVDAQEEEKLQLQAKLQEESASKDASYRTNVAKIREVESLQKRMESLANYWQIFKSTTQQELVSDREASKQEILSLTEQLSKLQLDLQKQKAMKQRGSTSDETRTILSALEAELLQLQKDSEKDAKDREEAYKCESEARARDQADGMERLQTMGEENLKQVTVEKMQLQRELQNELTEQDTMYQTKIAEIDADNAGEMQALQARLEKVTNEYQDFKVTTDARQKELGDIQATNENYDALVQENLTLQTTLNDKNEVTKRQDLKAQDFMKLFKILEEELPQLQKGSDPTVEGMQAAYDLEREGQAEDKSSAAKTLKELQEKARQYVVSLEEQGRDKTERVRNELTDLVAQKEALISKQQAIIDKKDQQIMHDRKPSVARLAVTEGITDNLRTRLFEKGNEIRSAEAMMARQNELIAELSADRGSVKALSQQALQLFQRRAATQVDLLRHQLTSRVKREKKHRAMLQTAQNDNDDGENDDREDNDDWSGQEEENDDDDEFDSNFADWQNDPEDLVSAWSTAVSTAKTLTHPVWRRLQNLVGHASSGSARHLWNQTPLTFSAVQRDRLLQPPEDVTWEERRKSHSQAHGTRSIRTSFGLVKVYNREASPTTPMQKVTYPRAHGTRSIRTTFGAVEVYNRVASPTPLVEEVTCPQTYGTRSIQTSFGPVEVYNRVPSPTSPMEKVFSDEHLQRQMTRTS
jgi:hypothetical protein